MIRAELPHEPSVSFYRELLVLTERCPRYARQTTRRKDSCYAEHDGLIAREAFARAYLSSITGRRKWNERPTGRETSKSRRLNPASSRQ